MVWVDIDSANTIRNLEANPRTEVNVVDPYIRKGYRFSGTGTVLRSGPSYSKAVEMYRAEGADIGRIRAVAFVKVEGLAPLVSPAYALGLTEREVGRLWEEYYTKSFQKTVKDLIPPQEF